MLLHGLTGSVERTWAATGWLRALHRRGWHAAGIDLLGHGESERPHDPAAYADLASHVEARLAGGARTHLVGFSLGAKVALELACRAPDAVHALVLLGLGENAFRPERPDLLVAGLAGGSVDDAPSVVRELVAEGLADGNDPAALSACLRRPANPRLDRERLAALTMPVTLVVGEDDGFIGDPGLLADALADAELVTIPGVGHLGTPRSPAVRAAVLDRLEGLVSGRDDRGAVPHGGTSARDRAYARAVFTDEATVTTTKPSAYLKQLCRHFGHKLDVTFDDERGDIALHDSRCVLEAGDETLVLVASAGTADGLEHARRVIGSHLERFGRRDGLTVTWRRASWPVEAAAGRAGPPPAGGFQDVSPSRLPGHGQR